MNTTRDRSRAGTVREDVAKKLTECSEKLKECVAALEEIQDSESGFEQYPNALQEAIEQATDDLRFIKNEIRGISRKIA